LYQAFSHRLKAINFPVAHHIAAVQLKGLHPLRRQTHDGKAVKPQQAAAGVYDAAVVGAPGDGPFKPLLKKIKGSIAAAITHNRTHNQILRIKFSIR